MLVVQNTEHFRIESPSIVTIGTFDGVHLGHKKILNRLKDIKAKTGLKTVVLTFEPHPRTLLFPDQKDLKLLSTIEEKLQLLENEGIDITVVYPFSKQFALSSAEFYIRQILVKNLNVKYLVIGYDHRFGANREGDFRTLEKYSTEFNYQVEEISVEDIDNSAISSSKIRNALLEHDLDTATAFLGHPYSLSGKVIEGKKLGRQIDYPTANIHVESPLKLIPAIGVYFVEVELDSTKYFGMLNIGKNPTTDIDENIKIEVNIFNFNEDIYQRNLKINFITFIRDEMKFNSLEELKDQLKDDKEQCLHLIHS